MKKLLILMLVLGISSAANAAILLSVDGDTSQDEIDLFEDDTAVIGVYSIDTDYFAYLDFGYVSEGGFELNNPRCPWAYIDPPWTGPYEYGDMLEFELVFFKAVGFYPPGILFEVDLTCLKADVDVYVELYDAGTLALVDSLTIHQVPEPMTLALLGLGGLLALRRRK